MADKILVTAIKGAHMLPMGRSTFWRGVSTGCGLNLLGLAVSRPRRPAQHHLSPRR